MTIKSKLPSAMLFARLILFAAIQGVFALGFHLTGVSNAWERSADWWPSVVIIANTICIALLARLFRAEGRRYSDIFHIDRAHLKNDLLIFLGISVLAGPVSMLPNTLLGSWLFGDPNATLAMFVRPLPSWAVYTLIFLFPVTQGLAELATYFGYAMPRLRSGSLALILPALMLSFQHITMPLLFDLRFVLWRGLMYLPFALLVGVVLQWRPRLLPFFAILHVLMNMAFATMFLSTAY